MHTHPKISSCLAILTLCIGGVSGSTTASENEQLEDVQLEYMQVGHFMSLSLWDAVGTCEPPGFSWGCALGSEY